MKLLVNYKGINKIMQSVDSYESIVKFIEQSFFLRMSKWRMHYVDSQGDQISLDSQVDFTTLIETSQKDYIKIYVVDKEEEKENQILGENDDDHDLDVVLGQVKVQQNQEVKVQVVQPTSVSVLDVGSVDVVETKTQGKENNIIKENNLPIQDQENKEKCFEGFEKHREQWKKRIEEKMAKFFDERLQAMMPCIIKRVEDQIKNQKPRQKKRQGIEHNVKCNGCGIQPIIGICYRSTKITSFNLCQNCQNEIEHEHNMIKMKRLEEEIKEQSDEQFGKFWWKKHWNQMNSKECEGRQGQECRGRWGNWDPRIGLTKKCFKLRSHFGGEAEDYVRLVEENPRARGSELLRKYVEMNPNKKVNNELNEKSKQKVQKLNFYFRDDFDFRDVVKENPISNLKQLISIIRESKLLQNKTGVVKVVQPVQQKEEKKELIVTQETMISPERIKPEKPVLDSAAKVKKRNDFVLQMKEYFGPENVMSYISFFEKWGDLDLEDITQKYIETTYQ